MRFALMGERVLGELTLRNREIIDAPPLVGVGILRSGRIGELLGKLAEVLGRNLHAHVLDGGTGTLVGGVGFARRKIHET